MRIGTIARQLGTTPEAIRFYERNGLLPAPERRENGYRDYTDQDATRLRLLLGLRSLDLPLDQSASLATLCAAGRCDQVSAALREALTEKRAQVARRIKELRFLDGRLADLSGQLDDGASPRDTIPRKEERDGL